jgi:ABC-2 type transport system ATP-binding protein
MSNAIESVDLSRRFRRLEAVEALNLQVPAGSVFGLVGPNGAGKTTTIKLLMNLVRPTRGSAVVLGTNSRRLAPRDLQRIGYVSENQRLPGWMTPARLLAYCRPFYPAWDEALCRKLQADLNLPSNTRLRTLSRGTRMKTALLASLAYRPDLVMLDEPFSGLDPLVRDELIRALLELAADNRDRPMTVFVSSHDIEELERLADWIGFIDCGRLVFAEPVSSLLARFRLVDVVARDGVALRPAHAPGWLPQGAAGRTIQFIDTNHAAPDAERRIAAAWPDADIRLSPLSLREIFVALARQASGGVEGSRSGAKESPRSAGGQGPPE